MQNFFFDRPFGRLGALSALVLVFLVVSVVIQPGGSAGAAQIANGSGETIIIETEVLLGGFQRLVDLKLADDGRLFVAQTDGIVRVVKSDGTLLAEPFLDISDLVEPSSELGLSSIALHPDFTTNGRFFVNYDTPELETFVVSYTESVTQTNTVDPQSAKTILQLQQPSPLHNGGNMVFGPDGYLYIGFGDGGPGGDPNNYGQNGENLFGSIIRIDVDVEQPGDAYDIPPDNPFVGNENVLDEIWDMGFRNPWRFSFDRTTGDLYIGDVGQALWEEIDFEEAGTGGFNYGWRCYEGTEPFNLDGCGDPGLYTPPVHTMDNEQVCAVIGGYVYRGETSLPIDGQYLYADFCTGVIWSLVKEGETWVRTGTGRIPSGWALTFGEGPDGQLYITDFNTIYKISAISYPTQLMFPLILN